MQVSDVVGGRGSAGPTSKMYDNWLMQCGIGFSDGSWALGLIARVAH